MTMTPSQALRHFAVFLDQRKASTAQIELSPGGFNAGVAHALVWVAKMARERADELEAQGEARS